MICYKTFVFVLFSLTLRGTSQQKVEPKDDLFELTIVHINDYHARYEPIGSYGTTCDRGETCIGGYARTVYTVKRLLKKNKNAVFFNTGDIFEGTFWYDIGRGELTSELLNMMQADAMTLGTHEFDHGIEGVVPLLDKLQKTPVLVANMDSSKEPTMTGKYKNSMIIEKSNRKIGVIGVTSIIQNTIGNIGNLVFLDEGATIEREAANLKSQGANIIIALSHCGFDVDKVLAEYHGSEIDVIVGANSHTFLYTGNNAPGVDKPKGDYPTVVKHTSGHPVLIVQAGEYGKYVGELTVNFDKNGEIVKFKGAPIYMEDTVPQDPKVVTALMSWKQKIVNKGNEIVGKSLVPLYSDSCKYEECVLGNLFCDAMVNAFLDFLSTKDHSSTQVPIGIVNYKALQDVHLYSGNITYFDFTTMSRFKNILTVSDLPGERLLEALEFGASGLSDTGLSADSTRFLHVAGLSVTYDLKKPKFKRVVDIKVRHEPFSKTSTYRIVAPNDLIYGTDDFHMIRQYISNAQSFTVLSDALMRYIKKQSPINAGVEGRIVFLK